MDFSKLMPTDNLYKFMAIAGVVAAFGSFYLRDKKRSEFLDNTGNLNTKIVVGMANFHQLLPFGEMIGMPDENDEPLPHYSTQNLDVRMRYLQHLQMHTRILVTLCQVPKKDDPVARKQWMGYFNWDDKTYEANLADPELKKIREINKQAWALRGPNEDLQFDFMRMWEVLDDFIRWNSIYFWTGTMGAIMMFLGFGLWYFRVQKYQDDIAYANAITECKDITPRVTLEAKVFRWTWAKITSTWGALKNHVWPKLPLSKKERRLEAEKQRKNNTEKPTEQR